ncbi:MAG: biosynthetic-type acetolactate synthase large subunit [bacterium]
MLLNGADIIIQSLKDQGVDCVFGYPGGAVLHIYDALAQQQDVRHILVRHEQGATHAADGYARATGKPGVVLVTSGPGATNTVTGIATAHMDSIPMVVITGQVPRAVIGSDAFQEVDTVGITRPCVKHNFLVKDINELADIVAKAFHIATTGRPGPVVVDVPKDITDPDIKIKYQPPAEIKMRSYNPVTKGNPRQIKKAAELIKNAKSPVIYSGGGVVLDDAADLLTTLTEMTAIPVTSTLMGLGAVSGEHENFLGMLGMHGTYEANMAMHETDVLIAIGARFDDRVTGKISEFCPNASIIHIDIDPASISKTVRVDVPIVGSVKNVLVELLKLIEAQPNSIESLKPWWDKINSWRAKDCLSYPPSDDVIRPQFAVETLHKVTQGDLVLTSDVGQHQMWAAQYYKFSKPRRWINSGGLGTMGFGLPAAIGAKLACPEQSVACITGEASIMMCIQELATCKQFNLPIKVILLNNGYMGMVRQWQEFFYESRYSHSYVDALPDFVSLAQSFGHKAIRVTRPQDLEPALKEAFADKDNMVFIEVVVDPEANVYPMLEAGEGQHKMVLSPHLNDRELA